MCKPNQKKMTVRHKNLPSFSLLNKKEHGSLLMDELGVFLVLMFCIVMILTYASYTKIIQNKMTIDNKVKEYLYVLEEEGYLSSAKQAQMKTELENLGITIHDFVGTTTSQVEYGTKVRLKCKVSFSNQLYEQLSGEKHQHLFTIIGLSPTITHQVDMTSTSKW